MEERVVNANPGLTNPSRAIYGFAFYILTYGLLGLYLVWALLPDEWLQCIGLIFLPQKYWAVAVPVYGMVLIITLLFLYVCYSMVLTPPLTDSRILTDSHAIYGIENKMKTEIPPLVDLPISVVSRTLYYRTDSSS